MDRARLVDSVLALVTETATNLPADVRVALRAAKAKEDAGTRAALAMATIFENVDAATEDVRPICQDTGMPTFFVHGPVGMDLLEVEEAIREAVVLATRQGKLRPNSVDSLTGENAGDNLGPGCPVVHAKQWRRPELEIQLILKGGGCENKNIQYSLPMELPGLGKAGRNLDGVRKCLLHAVHQAQGQGCSAGFIGVCIGGDRTTGYEEAKHQLLRSVDDLNPHPELAKLEAYVMETANQLGVGTMGFGGEVTLLGCKVGVLNRLPASFFVSVAYNCWAYRRLGVVLDPQTGEIQAWQHRAEPGVEPPMAPPAAAPAVGTGQVHRLEAPITEAQIRALKVGDVVEIDGLLHTGRDAIHQRLMDQPPPVSLQGGVLYHCGPVALKQGEGGWKIMAAGPTTSIREEPYQAEVIKNYGVRVVIGKGGMGPKTLAGLQASGAVYLNAIGGAAQSYARCVEAVEGVDWLELGVPEAMWHLRVKGFRAIVTMDSHGGSLHAQVEASSAEKLAQHAAPVF